MRLLFYQDLKSELLKEVCSSKPGGALMLSSIEKASMQKSFGEILHLLPECWVKKNPTLEKVNLHTYSESCWMIPDLYKKSHSGGVLLINGNTFCNLDDEKIHSIINTVSSDVVLIEVREHLLTGREAIRVTPTEHIVGFRRFYESEIEPVPLLADWPSIVYLNKKAWTMLSRDGRMPLEFSAFLKKIQETSLNTMFLKVGGQVLDFRNEQSLLAFLEEYLPDSNEQVLSRYPNVRMVGRIAIGKDVKIGDGTLLIGPVIISDNVEIGANSTIRRAYMTEKCFIPDGRTINQRVLIKGQETNASKQKELLWSVEDFFEKPSQPDFKGWPFYSYARFGKRIFDILFASIILIMLLPIFIVVAILIKLTSPGPIFYEARRQGHHGKEFGCLKFRTMIVQADAMQERLRVVNQVDGPQFKMEHDPRISGFGKFLRDTCIDELPQFLNVLFGQMSVVGPRPSPAKENESSPAWRDARLSVRPGITGLWQISRTRQASMDFQEWVHYDTEYVRKLSFRQDMSICYRTAKMLILTFLDQFG